MIDVHGERHYFDRLPDRCPLCGNGVKPEELASNLSAERDALNYEVVEVIYRCPLDACRRAFIARYRCAPCEGGTDRFGGTRPGLRLFECVPRSPLRYRAPAEVSSISAQFEVIMGQAYTAQQYGLDQIAGGGFRKALEFLIKDFCCAEHPDDVDAICRLQLGPCIERYVTDDNVKITATRASWLGNDELHYERRYVDRDIEHMKGFIKLVVNWIESLLKTRALQADMPDTKGRP